MKAILGKDSPSFLLVQQNCQERKETSCSKQHRGFVISNPPKQDTTGQVGQPVGRQHMRKSQPSSAPPTSWRVGCSLLAREGPRAHNPDVMEVMEEPRRALCYLMRGSKQNIPTTTPLGHQTSIGRTHSTEIIPTGHSPEWQANRSLNISEAMVADSPNNGNGYKKRRRRKHRRKKDGGSIRPNAKSRSREGNLVNTYPSRLNSSMTSQLDLSCLISPHRGRDFLKAPELPHTIGAKYTKLAPVHRTELDTAIGASLTNKCVLTDSPESATVCLSVPGHGIGTATFNRLTFIVEALSVAIGVNKQAGPLLGISLENTLNTPILNSNLTSPSSTHQTGPNGSDDEDIRRPV
uniref:Uncharacterized protein n=1 Tax=Timema cristinae TaxID=61476 RepID=A0A7R9DFB9_TIMCR|nr:unnamed protein product [Timema cristinae]